MVEPPDTDMQMVEYLAGCNEALDRIAAALEHLAGVDIYTFGQPQKEQPPSPGLTEEEQLVVDAVREDMDLDPERNYATPESTHVLLAIIARLTGGTP